MVAQVNGVGNNPVFGCQHAHQAGLIVAPNLRIELSDRGPVAVGLTRQGGLVAMPLVNEDQFVRLVNGTKTQEKAQTKTFSFKNILLLGAAALALYAFRKQIGGLLDKAKSFLSPTPEGAGASI